MSEPKKRTTADAIADLAAKAVKEPKALTVGEDFAATEGESPAEVLLVPQGYTVESIKRHLDEYRTKPARRRGTAKFTELASFTEWVNRFKDEAHSAIFADRSNEAAPKLIAVIDYNERTYTGAPRFGQHRAEYPFPLADEWKTWKERDAKPFDQQAFAEFIESHVGDVIDPAGAGAAALEFQSNLGCTFAAPGKLLELSRGLEVRVGAHVKQAVKLESGESQLTYHEEHKDTGGAPIKIPSAFIIGVSVFRNGPLYQVPVRLRYRAGGGSITWFYELYRDDAVFDDAFREACEMATEETKLPLFMGTPET